MRIRLFTFVTTSILALGLCGCRVQSTLVMPSLAPVPYASAGETLEFRAFGPNASSSYVVFYGTSPCMKPYYLIRPGKPARCKVRSGLSGYFQYDFEPDKPSEGKFLSAKSCHYCQVVAVGVGNSSSSVSSQPDVNSDSRNSVDAKSNSNKNAGVGRRPYPPLQVSCDADTKMATIDNPIDSGVQYGDRISWISVDGSSSPTVTMPSGVCSGGQKGIFTDKDVCTVTGAPGTYNYSVSLDQCPNSGHPTLNINSNPPPS